MKQTDPWKYLIRRELSSGEFVTLLALERLVRKDVLSGWRWIPMPVTRLAKEAAVSPVTAKQHLRHLKRCGFIDVRFGGCGVTTMVLMLEHPFKALGEAA